MSIQEGTGALVPKRDYTLKELVENFNQIEEQITSAGEEVGDDIVDLHNYAKQLVEGKFDRVCSARDSIEAHSKACAKQIEYNNFILSRIDSLIEEVVRGSEGQKMTGLVYSAKVKKNPASLIVKDEDLIPSKFFNFKVEIKDKFNFDDVEKMEKYRDFVLGRKVTEEFPLTPEEISKLDDCIDSSVDKNAIKAAMKNKEEVPGVALESTEKILIERSKVAAGKMIGE